MYRVMRFDKSAPPIAGNGMVLSMHAHREWAMREADMRAIYDDGKHDFYVFDVMNSDELIYAAAPNRMTPMNPKDRQRLNRFIGLLARKLMLKLAWLMLPFASATAVAYVLWRTLLR